MAPSRPRRTRRTSGRPYLAAGAAVLAALAGCGGDGQQPVLRSLPPQGRLFGFSDETFAHTGGPEPALDQQVTAAQEVAAAQAAGANSARIVVSWWDLEPAPGRLDGRYVARLKAFTDPFERTGGRVLLVLGVPPPWASAKPGDPRAAIVPTPANVRSYARFAALVARLWPRAAAIETWNEPNTRFFWKPRAPEPALFARMHRAAAAAIWAVAPRTRVVFGGLLAAPDGSAQIASVADFLGRAYAAGLRRDDYDALGLHVYPDQSGGRMHDLDGGHFAESLRNFADGHSGEDPDARVWVTETGLSTSGPDALSPSEQATGLRRVLAKLLGERNVDAVFVHTLYEVAASPPASIERGYGVLRAAGARRAIPKPAFCDLVRLASRAVPFSGCREGRSAHDS